jgi:hypothetical protein
MFQLLLSDVVVLVCLFVLIIMIGQVATDINPEHPSPASIRIQGMSLPLPPLFLAYLILLITPPPCFKYSTLLTPTPQLLTSPQEP